MISKILGLEVKMLNLHVIADQVSRIQREELKNDDFRGVGSKQKSEGAYWLANSIDCSAFWEDLEESLRFSVLWGASGFLRYTISIFIQNLVIGVLYKSGGVLPPC